MVRLDIAGENVADGEAVDGDAVDGDANGDEPGIESDARAWGISDGTLRCSPPSGLPGPRFTICAKVIRNLATESDCGCRRLSSAGRPVDGSAIAAGVDEPNEKSASYGAALAPASVDSSRHSNRLLQFGQQPSRRPLCRSV